MDCYRLIKIRERQKKTIVIKLVVYVQVRVSEIEIYFILQQPVPSVLSFVFTIVTIIFGKIQESDENLYTHHGLLRSFDFIRGLITRDT